MDDIFLFSMQKKVSKFHRFLLHLDAPSVSLSDFPVVRTRGWSENKKPGTEKVLVGTRLMQKESLHRSSSPSVILRLVD